MPAFQENEHSDRIIDRSSQASPCEQSNLAQRLVEDIRGESESEAAIVILDRQTLSRECLARSLAAVTQNQRIFTFSTAEEWMSTARHVSPISLILLCIGGQNPENEEVSRAVALLSQVPKKPPIILLSDVEDASQILSAIRGGVRGYITTNVTLKVAIEAMHLVRAGGIYLPAASLLSLKPVGDSPPLQDYSNVFSDRQRAVLRAVREGKANKLIAYELNMTEGTVKVHIRNIMRKLNAKNRTEVAFKTNEMFIREERGSSQRGNPEPSSI